MDLAIHQMENSQGDGNTENDFGNSWKVREKETSTCALEKGVEEYDK